MRELTTAELGTLNQTEAQAIGYVWGRQDAGDGAYDSNAAWYFGQAYRERKRAYLAEESSWMPNIRDAFDYWSRLGEIPLDHDRLRLLEAVRADEEDT
jgi:hypothetical protein